MSRKQSRTGKPPSPTSAGASGKETDALAHLEKGRYRDAIDAYKTLLKQERRPDWLNRLAEAYTGRAHALADKGMRREAIEIWRSRADVCGKPLWEGPYTQWLLDENRLTDVLTHLSARRNAPDHVPGEKPNEELAALEWRLAPAILVADEALLATLPADSPLVRHRTTALSALTAYAQHEDSALETALASIPFRSPYRDLRLILKALVLRETDAAAAHAAIMRLPADGPFERLAAPLRMLPVFSDDSLSKLATLNPAQQDIAFDLLGCPPTQTSLLRALITASDAITPPNLFDLVLKHSAGLPNVLATRVWQRLSPHAKRRGCESPRFFGSPTPAAEECATALAHEISGDREHAETHWTNAAQHLAVGGDADNRLRAALILRNAALSSVHLARDGVLDASGAKLLTDSLEFDVYDRDVHVRLIQFWRKIGDMKKARARLDVGLTYFPDDVAMLAESVETALAGGAFKKAATTARRLLELDPLNAKVRSMIGNAHLSHAAKQIAASKPDAASAEIDEAATWLNGPTERGRMLALRAWSASVGTPERLRLSQEAVACWGGGLVAGWRLLRETHGVFTHIKAALLLDEAGINPETPLTTADILQLIQAMEHEPLLTPKGMDPLAPWRKAIEAKAAELVRDAETAIQICEVFSRYKENNLVEKFAEAARKRWPNRPIFIYHAVAARFGKQNSIAHDRDFDDLEEAYRCASMDNDHRLKMRIDTLFAAEESLLDSDNVDDFDSPFDPASIDERSIRAMIEMSIQSGGEKAFLAKARQEIGSEFFKQLERESGGNRKVLLKRIVDALAEAMAIPVGTLPPFIPAKKIPKIKINEPDPAQGNLFDD